VVGEDVLDQPVGYQVVIVPVPPRWGRTTVHEQLQERIDAVQEWICQTFTIRSREFPSRLDRKGLAAGRRTYRRR
jgi:hypothetical protein